MFCAGTFPDAVSGQPCSEPMVGHSGYIFERRVIEAHLHKTATCPVSGAPMQMSELIAVRVSPNSGDGERGAGVPCFPKPVAATSIPFLLRSVQHEWDATVLETHGLRTQQAALQQELSSALYQLEASRRLIARLLAEKRTEGKQVDPCAMSVVSSGSSSPTEPTSPHAAPAPVQSTLLASDQFLTYFVDVLNSTNGRLSKSRKHRRTAETATIETVASFKEIFLFDTPYLGISMIKTVQSAANAISHLVIAGKTRGTTMYNYKNLTVLPNWPVKQSKVTALCVLSHDPADPQFIIGRKDVVSVVDSLKIRYDFRLNDHIRSLDAHPSGVFFATLTYSNEIHLHYVPGKCILYKLTDTPAETRIIRFHPDGMMLAAVARERVYIFGVRRQDLMAEINCLNFITHLVFSENGFHMATAENEGKVKIWDLRKLTVVGELSFDSEIQALEFDYTGIFLAIAYGGPCIQPQVSFYAFQSKQWKEVGSPLQTGFVHPVSALAWGLNSTSISIASTESKAINFAGANMPFSVPKTEANEQSWGENKV